MKKIILAFIVLTGYQISSPAQVITDTSRAGGRGGRHGNVPISTMTNTITIPTTTPSTTTTNPAVTTVTTTGSGSSGQTLTVEELTRKVNDLQDQLNNIQNKLPFQDMAFVEITADLTNLSGVENNYRQLKIDNPLSNNNPKALLFYSPQGSDYGQIKGITYSAPYWYASFYDIIPVSIEPYSIKFYIHDADGDFYGLQQRDILKSGSYSNAFQIGSRKPLEPGNKFSFIIFRQFPNVNPAYNHLINTKQ